MRRDQPAIGVAGVARGNALGNDTARRVPPEMDHLCAGVDLLIAVGDGDRVELAARAIAAQDAARILPGDGGAGLDLCPGDVRVAAMTVAALRDEVEDAAAALAVARIPVLHRRVLD